MASGVLSASDTMMEVKREPSEIVDLESRILELCRQCPDGITDAQVLAAVPSADVKQRASAINRLLSRSQIDIYRSDAASGTLIYKLKDSSASKARGGDSQEKLIYQIVEEASSKGIWTRDIRFKSNLPPVQINKILKSLESKKLIKAVKPVSAPKKKMYMLANLQPDRSVTGGAWYSDQDFDYEFVDVLNQQCLKYLQQKVESAKASKVEPIAQRNASYASSEEVWKYIKELGISKTALAVGDIETILDTLIYDGKAEKTVVAAPVGSGSSGSTESGTINLYHAVSPLVRSTGLVRVPCGVCPLVNQCTEDGVISPKTCIYLKEWLEL